ncbi:serine protease Do-like HtrB [Clostridium acetireducens DSM 10703]|jgi:serine protease Do|uniref:Serine protease Do-like HtrB n=1 Tax=Clostridium acetireducens DSM 10703 TaxID=1121290 RepID=A0A1E8EZM0_9CLOT|nr:trypsin-like peptidase domain-containing protein [Clostridium acetireducens]OFI06578.1 serine protease Do-like HtrB [Clostridium acetireducens DSM 10703]
MDDKDKNNIKDVKWQDVSDGKGEIIFKSSRRKRIRSSFKILVIIIISAVIGGISGAYIVNNKYQSMDYNQWNQFDNSSEKNVSNAPKSSITKVAETVGPAVVGISKKAQGFFGVEDVESGSGIIFDVNGYIVTNNHVIKGADKVTVKLSNGKILEAKVIGTDPRSDLAVIKVEAKNLPVAKFGDSSKVRVGDKAVAIGNPLGEEFAGSVTSGIISALNRKIQYGGAIYKVLQTDAAINPGNSGGALCNEYGEVIGINSLKIGSEKNVEGMGFAIAINEAKSIIKSLMEKGKVSRPYLGIYGQSVISEKNNVQGVYVNEVIDGSGAKAAGIQVGDVVIELDNKKINRFEDLAEILDNHKIGDAISCKIWRNGKTLNKNIILSEMKDSDR